jgi:mTERF domain-containing protein
LAAKPKSLLQKHPLYTPTLANKVSLQIKKKTLCLEIMRYLRYGPVPKPFFTQLPSNISTVISFLQSKGILQKALSSSFSPKMLKDNVSQFFLGFEVGKETANKHAS